MATSGEETRFPAAAVQAHASTVGEICAAMEQARSAVHETSMDTQAYGQLCQFLPTMLSPIFELVLDAVRDTVESLDETAANLRIAVSATTSTDTDSARRIQATRGDRPAPKIELPL